MVAAQVKKNRSFFLCQLVDFLMGKDIWQTLNSTPKDQTKVYHICWLRVFNLIPHFEEYSQVLLWTVSSILEMKHLPT
jgi:hypothetical protein